MVDELLSLLDMNVLMVASDSICHRYLFSPCAEDATGRSRALNPTKTKQK